MTPTDRREALCEAARRIAAAAPPLTPEQRVRLAILLRPAPVSACVKRPQHLESMPVTHSELTFEEHFGSQVRAARETRGWSQEALALRLKDEGLDIHQSGIARLEQGQRAIRLNEAAALSQILGLDLTREAARAEELGSTELSGDEVERLRTDLTEITAAHEAACTRQAQLRAADVEVRDLGKARQQLEWVLGFYDDTNPDHFPWEQRIRAAATYRRHHGKR